ncbi:MAG: hypothetical protein NTY19_30280 [Planctomycetota bacterium]|nr:hypothetical protein [Planctomycetota bacterium]
MLQNNPTNLVVAFDAFLEEFEAEIDLSGYEPDREICGVRKSRVNLRMREHRTGPCILHPVAENA